MKIVLIALLGLQACAPASAETSTASASINTWSLRRVENKQGDKVTNLVHKLESQVDAESNRQASPSGREPVDVAFIGYALTAADLAQLQRAEASVAACANRMGCFRT